MSHAHRWLALVLAAALVAPAAAQTPAPVPPTPPRPPAAPMAPPIPVPPTPPLAPRPPALGAVENESRRIDIVLSRYVGDKRIESLPFSLLSSATGQNSRSSIRLGLEVPTGRVRTSSENGVVRSEPVMVYVGTNIDCGLSLRDQGVYSLTLSLTHTMLASIPREPPPASGPVTPQPVVVGPATRTVGLSNMLTLREGRSQLFSLGVDQITGETVRAEVTVTTVK